MDARLYERMKRQYAQRRAAELAAVEDEYKRLMSALETLWTDAQKQQVNPASASPAASPKPHSSGGIRGRVTGVRSAIRRAIVGMTSDFDADPIYDKVKIEYPDVERRAVTDALFRMAQVGELEAVVAGKGRRKAIYRVPAQGGIVQADPLSAFDEVEMRGEA